MFRILYRLKGQKQKAPLSTYHTQQTYSVNLSAGNLFDYNGHQQEQDHPP